MWKVRHVSTGKPLIQSTEGTASLFAFYAVASGAGMRYSGACQWWRGDLRAYVGTALCRV
ncbi:hypothetical protein AA103196_1802 [Ameyamaea chiangmaiensis NBRC 103196]|nr:hypothetical protein AA103196_1802 [Ameyamaea chiangmaiensis NBRC 103196]